MEYSVEDISPVKKKISVRALPGEVDAAIGAAVAVARESTRLDGFRKGKVPPSIIENRFHDHIYNEARQDLINAHLNQILNALSLNPVSGIEMEGADEPLKKGGEFAYTMEFEVMPDFQLPPYEGMEVEQEETVVDPGAIEAIFERMRRENATMEPVPGNAPAKDGEIANIDFEAFENGQPVPGAKAMNFDLEIGARQSLPEFEKLVKGIPVGNTAEEKITFPPDFIAESLAGKTVDMKVRVNAVKKLVLPELDDEFAKKMEVESLEKLREGVGKAYEVSSGQLHKSVAQKKLLDQMLKLCDFPLPPSYVDLQARFLLGDMGARLERHGKSLKSLGKSLDELLAEMRPQAETMAREQILLLGIAKKEGLEVQPNEVTREIYNNCARSGEDFRSTMHDMEQSGLIFQVRDRLLADKAMDLVYAKANVKMTPPSSDAGESGAAAEDPTKDPEAAKPAQASQES